MEIMPITETDICSIAIGSDILVNSNPLDLISVRVNIFSPL